MKDTGKDQIVELPKRHIPPSQHAPSLVQFEIDLLKRDTQEEGVKFCQNICLILLIAPESLLFRVSGNGDMYGVGVYPRNLAPHF